MKVSEADVWIQRMKVCLECLKYVQKLYREVKNLAVTQEVKRWKKAKHEWSI